MKSFKSFISEAPKILPYPKGTIRVNPDSTDDEEPKYKRVKSDVVNRFGRGFGNVNLDSDTKESLKLLDELFSFVGMSRSQASKVKVNPSSGVMEFGDINDVMIAVEPNPMGNYQNANPYDPLDPESFGRSWYIGVISDNPDVKYAKKRVDEIIKFLKKHRRNFLYRGLGGRYEWASEYSKNTKGIAGFETVARRPVV